MAHQDVDFKTYFIRFFLPVIICLVLVFVMSQSALNYYYNLAQTPPPSATPVQPDETGSNQAEVGIANMLIYVFMAFAGGMIILFLMKKGLFTVIQVLFGAILGFSALLLGLFFYGFVFRDLFIFLISSFSFLQTTSAISFLSFLYYVSVIGLSIISGIVGFVVMIDMKWVPMILRNGMIVLFGASVGSYLGIHFPVLSAVFVLIGLAIYDVYAVFKGPLKGILSEIGVSSESPTSQAGDVLPSAAREEVNIGDLPTERVELPSDREKIESSSATHPDHPMTLDDALPLTGALEGEEVAGSDNGPNRQVTMVQVQSATMFPGLPIYSDGIISIGLGDFAFYSMLVAHALKITWLLHFNLIPLLLTLIGVLAGALITLHWLIKQKVLPGLPMSIFLGIIGLFLGIIIAIPNIEQIQWLLSQ